MAARRAELDRPVADRVCLAPGCGAVVPASDMRLLCAVHDARRALRLQELVSAGQTLDIGDVLRSEFGV